jgi:hypothetical protein
LLGKATLAKLGTTPDVSTEEAKPAEPVEKEEIIEKAEPVEETEEEK